MSGGGRKALTRAPALISVLIMAGLCAIPAFAASDWVDDVGPEPLPLAEQFTDPITFSGSGAPPGASISAHEVDPSDGALLGDELCPDRTVPDSGSWLCEVTGGFYAPGDHVFRVVVTPRDEPAQSEDVVVTIGPSALKLKTQRLEPGTNVVTITGVRDAGERFRVTASVVDEAPTTGFAPMALTIAECDSTPFDGDQFSCTADLDDDLPVGSVIQISLGEDAVTDSGDAVMSGLQIIELIVGAPSGPVSLSPPGGSLGGPSGAGAVPLFTPPGVEAESDDPPAADAPEPEVDEAGPVESIESDVPSTLDDLDIDDPLPLLILGALAFALWSMIGPPGLALASDPQRLRDRSLVAGSEQIDGDDRGALALGLAVILGTSSSKESVTLSRRYGQRWGDRSPTWHLPGWKRLDRVSKHLPPTLSRRFVLVSRVGADANYLRAAFGVAWLALPFAGLVLGIIAAADSDWLPTAPSIWLTGVLIVLAVLDSAAGAAAVVGFTGAVLIAGGPTFGEIGFLDGVSGLLDLAVLWFVVPLVGAAARPFRRLSDPERRYRWDRAGDALIAALASGLVVFAAAAGLEDLTGQPNEVSKHAGTLALLAAGVVALRVGCEEIVTDGYPSRLRAVQPLRPLSEPTRAHRLRAAVIGALMVLVFAAGVIGNCWQLWVGTAMCLIPGIVSAFDDRLPNVAELHRRLPRGIIRVFMVLVVGLLLAHALAEALHDQPMRALRDGFVVLALLPFALRCLDLIGRNSPAPPWTWPRQLAGAAIVAATIWVAFTML